MKRPIRILLQTTIPETEDDWHIGRFSLLRDHLASLKDEAGNGLCKVTARNRESDAGADDPVLSTLDRSDFDELWLFAVDVGEGLTAADCRGITRFRQRGGGVLATRDHQDLGSSLCTLGGVGRAHFFHTRNPDPDESRRTIDDSATRSISWPNYHSGSNGDYQIITPLEPVHELLHNPSAPSGAIDIFLLIRMKARSAFPTVKSTRASSPSAKAGRPGAHSTSSSLSRERKTSRATRSVGG